MSPWECLSPSCIRGHSSSFGSLSPRQWATTTCYGPVAEHAAVGPLKNAASVGPAGLARLQLRPSALMTYRLGHCGIQVSGQCHGRSAKTVGKKKKRVILSVLSGPDLAPGLCHLALHYSTQRMKDVKHKHGGEGRSKGSQELKGFHPVNWKDIIFWPADALGEVSTIWCENSEREGRKKKNMHGPWILWS